MQATPKATPSGSIKGYLDVKIPARKRKSISLFRVQVWKRHCWVVVRGDRSPAEVGTTTGSRSDQVNLSVEIYTQHEGSSNHPTEGTILHLDLVHKIRRAKSKSHPYAFEVCGRRGEALLYLSGTSETESQRWMSGVRCILWPPNHLEGILKTYSNTWEVSAITVGEVDSDWTSLGGLYGRLAVSGGSLLIKDIHNGSTKVEWPLVTVQKVYVATGGELEDEGKIFIVQTRSSHPCGETFLYFFSLELSDLLEGLHDAVSNLINKNGGDDTSVLSDLSELSGALSSVVVLPQRLQETCGGSIRLRKSNSVVDVSQLSEFTSKEENASVVPRLCSSQSNLTDENRAGLSIPGRPRLLSHFRRKSMSETNLTKICLDETDEELDSREDDLEDADLRPMDVPKDRTSSSGSYNSYRSNDSGVKLSASPSNYGEGSRVMAEHMARRFVSKSDSLDSGVRACVKEDVKESIPESENPNEMNKSDNQDNKGKVGAMEEVPDVETKVGAWCLQSARARKSLLVKNLSTCAHRDFKKTTKGLSRTMSESYKEVVDRNAVTDEYKRAMENPVPVVTKHTTVYEEIVDVLRPLSEKKIEKEHEYEELEKCRRDIKRSYSFQDKSQPPPLPPRRPQSFSPDPWTETPTSKTSALRKLFGLSFYNKSHSTDSMLEVETGDLEGRFINTTLGSDDMATVQALGTLPRIKRKSFERYEGKLCHSASPRMSPKQKLKSPYGVSPNRSPKIPRPRNLFIFKSTASKEEPQISPNTQAALKLHKQLTMQGTRTPSTDSSLQDAPTPDTPKHCSLHRGHWRGDYSQAETPDTSDDSTIYTTLRDPSTFLKSPKIVTKTFNFLRKFPKEKYSSLERKRKSAAFLPPTIPIDPGKVPNSYSLDSFAVEEGKGKAKDPDRKDGTDIRPRAMSFAPSSPAIQIPRKSCCYSISSTSPAGTPTSCTGSIPQSGSSPHSGTPWRGDYLRDGCLPPPPAHCEPQYANLGPDPEYMTVEEIRSAFKKGDADDGGYLSMGDLRNSLPRTSKDLAARNEQSYVSMREVQSALNEEFPILCKQSEEFYKHRSAYPLEHHHHYSSRYLGYPRGHNPYAAIKDEQQRPPVYKSAPSSRKTSCCDASDYLTPQEVSRLLRRELVSAHVREIPVDHHHHHQHPHHHHHCHH